MQSNHNRPASLAPAMRPVDRSVLFQSDRVELRENRCLRTDPSISKPTEPLPFDEICLPRRGVWIRHLGRQELVVSVNHVHFFERGEVHRVEHPAGCGDLNTGLILSPEALAEMRLARGGGEGDQRMFPCRSLRIGPIEFALHRSLVAVARDEHPDALQIEEGCLRLAAWLLARNPATEASPTPSAPHRDLVAAAKALLAAHFAEPLTLGDVATALHVSRFHLCRVFSALTGISLHRYLLQLRSCAALELLLAKARPLEEIAATTGFANRSQLSRHFVRAFGVSPSRMRAHSPNGRLHLAQLRLLLASNNRHA